MNTPRCDQVENPFTPPKKENIVTVTDRGGTWVGSPIKAKKRKRKKRKKKEKEKKGWAPKGCVLLEG